MSTTDPLEETQSQTLVRDLFTELFLDPYRGNNQVEVVEHVADDPDGFPSPGETVDGWNTRANWPGYTFTYAYMRLPFTHNGNYQDSVANRSNREALLEDYPGLFVHFSDGSEAELLLPLDSLIPETLAEAIESLCDYTIYDEDHYSDLLHKLLMEWWDDEGARGFTYELNEMLCPGNREVLYADFKVTPEWVNEQFWRIYHRSGHTYNDEDGLVSISEDVQDEIAEQIADQIITDWNAKVTWLHTRQEGLFS